MVRRRVVPVLLLATTLVTARVDAQGAVASCAPARTALVLSGGAAKGFAHIGVLYVLDSIGVKPDLIVGTSVGALVGSLYASGYSAREVDSLMRALPIAGVIRRYEPVVSSSLGLLKPMAVWERGRTGYRLQTGTAREAEVNALVASLTLRGNILARGNFDALPIPFRAVATDLVSQQAIVLGTGDLGYAVRASIALPLVFQPVRRDSTWLIDGAMSANTPVQAARELGAERVWASRLPAARPDANAFDDPLTLSAALVNTLFKDDGSQPRDGDVTINNPTQAFENLNFDRAVSDSLIRLGYATARAAFSAASCVRPLNGNGAGDRAPVRQPLAAQLRTGEVTLAKESPDEPALMARLGVVAGRAFDSKATADALETLARSERIHAVWLNPAGEGSVVSFRPALETASPRAFGFGMAFDQFMSGRLWIGGVDRSTTNASAEGVVVGQFGSYEQSIVGFARVRTRMRGVTVPLAAGMRFAHESVRLFAGNGELPNAETQEGEVFFGARDDPAAGEWKFDAMLDARLWREPGRDTRGSTGIRAAMYRARGEYEMGTILEALALTDFQRLRLDASRVFTSAETETRFRIRAGWGSRLPVQHQFTLGGADGFAGLRIGEIRGTQELFAALRFKRRVAPQLQVSGETMAGAIGSGYGALERREGTDFGKFFLGVRVGFEASTPIGPIRVEEGFSNTGQRALLVRVGYWF